MSCVYAYVCMCKHSITPRMSTDNCRDAVHEMDMQIKEQIERGTSPPPANSHYPRPTTARMTMAIHQRRPSALFVLARAEVRRFGSSRISIIAFLPAERHLLLLFFCCCFFLGGRDLSTRVGGGDGGVLSQNPHSFISPLTFFLRLFSAFVPLLQPHRNGQHLCLRFGDGKSVRFLTFYENNYLSAKIPSKS